MSETGWTTGGATQPWLVPQQQNNNRDQAIMAWQKAKEALDTAKANEMEMRKQLSAQLFPTPEKGTQRVALGNGWNIKLVHKLNYNLNKDTTDDALTRIEKNHEKEAGEMIAEQLVKWKPELSITAYNALSDADRKIIDSVLTVTDASPELTLEPPKAQK